MVSQSKMKAMKNSESYLAFLNEQLSRLGEISMRPMMGGHVVYCGGVPFALVDDNALFLKADNYNRPLFQARGLKPFQPFPDKPGTMSYFEVPPEMLEDAEALDHWAGGALEAGRRAQAKKKPKGPKARKRA
jgi:DNA transformation protein